MARVSTSRRAASGIAFIIAGALFVLLVLLPLLTVNLSWLAFLAYAAVAVALGILAFGAVNSTAAKVTLGAAAVGWALLAIFVLVPSLPAVLHTIAALVAGVAGLIGAIVVYVGKEVTNNAALAFIVATALGLLYLLVVIGTLPLTGVIFQLLVVLFGVALIATGVLFRRTERGRR